MIAVVFVFEEDLLRLICRCLEEKRYFMMSLTVSGICIVQMS